MEQTSKQKPGYTIVPTPVWILVLRVFQIVFSFIIVGCCGAFVHDIYSDQLGFAIICCLMTWIVSLYNILAEKVRACRKGYNVYATLTLDMLMIIFWLAAMGAIAEYRSQFKYNVGKGSCVNNGSALGGGECVVSGRALPAGTPVAHKWALDLVAGSAGVAAIIMLFYVTTFAYVCHYWRVARVSGGFSDTKKFDSGTDLGLAPYQVYHVEAHGHVQSHPVPTLHDRSQDFYAREDQYQQPVAALYDPYASQQVPPMYNTYQHLS